MGLSNRIDRRQFLAQAAAGAAVGGLSLRDACRVAAAVHDGQAGAPMLSHFPAKAKQLVIVFLSGGFSHIDTFDPKPRLKADDGKLASTLHDANLPQLRLLGSPFQFRQHGKSGLWISEIFPHLATVADDLCVIRSMHTQGSKHNQSVLAMHTGSWSVPMPSIGSWLSYGLGPLTRNLPAYMLLVNNFPYGGSQVVDNNFLPPVHQAVRIMPGREPIANLRPAVPNLTLNQLEQRLIHDANELHAASRRGDLNLQAAIESHETAQRMMRVAPEVFDLSDESKSTLAMYGIKQGDNTSLGWQCLTVRRLVERGVRVVELIDSGTNDNWDAHDDITFHRPSAGRVDRPVTALIRDLKQRGLLEETLVVICTEFGRTPWVDDPKGDGRNHHIKAFTCLLAGAGVRGGHVHGETDEHGVDVVRDPVDVHDYHATILHLMGIDHTQLTYRYAGRDFRLTDVHGNVVEKALA